MTCDSRKWGHSIGLNKTCLILKKFVSTCCVTCDFGQQSKRPFPPQFAVMNKMLRALQVGANALLESPTGTGKVIACEILHKIWLILKNTDGFIGFKLKLLLQTLAMLCSALAWQRYQEDLVQLQVATNGKKQSKRAKIPKIYFTSR